MKNTTVHVQVASLPTRIQGFLTGTGYARKDIRIEVCETASMFLGGGSGSRGYARVLTLATSAVESYRGSWGGSNPWSSAGNAVDTPDAGPLDMAGKVLVKGYESSGPLSATLYVHPSNLGEVCPPKCKHTECASSLDMRADCAGKSVSDKERKILACIGGLKAGPYRKDGLDRIGATAEEIDSLVARGFLSRNKAGAVSMTTEGKNARGNERAY